MSIAWEYGPEAFKEIPSWQDILMTGPVGSRVGEIFYLWRRDIDGNGGRVLGSTVVGGTVKFLLDPIGSLTRGLQSTITWTLSVRPSQPLRIEFDDEGRPSLLAGPPAIQVNLKW